MTDTLVSIITLILQVKPFKDKRERGDFKLISSCFLPICPVAMGL